MYPRILITGSSGLVGSVLKSVLEARRFEVFGLDILATGTDSGDVRDIDHVCTVRSATISGEVSQA